METRQRQSHAHKCHTPVMNAEPALLGPAHSGMPVSWQGEDSVVFPRRAVDRGSYLQWLPQPEPQGWAVPGGLAPQSGSRGKGLDPPGQSSLDGTGWDPPTCRCPGRASVVPSAPCACFIAIYLGLPAILALPPWGLRGLLGASGLWCWPMLSVDPAEMGRYVSQPVGLADAQAGPRGDREFHSPGSLCLLPCHTRATALALWDCPTEPLLYRGCRVS